MGSWRSGLASLSAVALVLGCGGGTGPANVRVPPFRSVGGVPPSGAAEVVVLPDGRSCTSDTYLIQVHCFDPESDRRWSFGREGEGPGEIKSPGPLLAVDGSDSTLAVVDYELARVTVFTLDGTYLESGTVPLAFWPYSTVRAGRITGTRIPVRMPELPREHVGRITILDIDGDGSPAEVELRLLKRPGEKDKLPFAKGALQDDSTVTVHVAGHRFAVFSLDGSFLRDFEYPAHLQEPIYPSELDLEEWISGVRSIFGRPPTDAEIEAQAETLLLPVLKGTNPALGPDSTFWVASPRDRVERSYIDVFRSGAYLGALEVRDRLLDFSITGDVLVALVKRTGENGAGPWRLDWYDIASVRRRLRP